MQTFASYLPFRQQIPRPFVVALIGLTLLAFPSANPVLTLACVLSLAIGVSLTLGSDGPRLFLFIFGYQWLQASAKVFHADVLNEPINAVADLGGDVFTSTLYALLAVVVLAAGARLGIGRRKKEPEALPLATLVEVDSQRWFVLYAGALAISILLTFFVIALPGLRIVLLALMGMKWAFFWLLAYMTFLRPTQVRSYFLMAFGFELLFALGGYFASFKYVFFYSMIAMAAARIRLSRNRVVALAAFGALVLAFGVVWSAVKTEYRAFVSGDDRQQIVAVTYGESIEKLAELVLSLDESGMGRGVDAMVARVGYVEFFGLVLDTVPAYVPFENGRIWLDAVMRPFTPRIFFPDKAEIDDSERTRQYTGRLVAGAAEGTSISVGYVAESYIDFGFPGMFVPIFMWGYLLGRFYAFLAFRSRVCGPIGQALAVAALLDTALFESSITKSFGGAIAAMIAATLLAQFVLPALLPIVLRVKARRRAR